MSHRLKILKALKSGVVIDPAYALHHFGCYRLSARIYDLRAAGHVIHSDRRPFKSRRHGHSGYTAAYWMDD